MEAKAQLLWPKVTVAADVHAEQVATGTVPDPAWRHVDSSGHGHFFDDGYPTLERCYRGCGDPDHDSDCEGEEYYVCRSCAEEVRPGTRDGGMTTVDWSVTYTMTVRGEGSTRTYVLNEVEWAAAQRALELALEAWLEVRDPTLVEYGGPG